MPRQPYLPHFSTKKYAVGALELKHRPDLCALIGKCVAIWGYVDNEMGYLFSLLLGTESEAALEVFLSLRRSTNQREAVEIAAKYALSGDDLLTLEAMLVVYRSLESQRNDIAHGCFGVSSDDPDILYWIPVKHHVHFQAEALSKEARGKFARDRHARLKQNLFVYRKADLESLYEEMEQFWWAVFYLNGYLRDRTNPPRVAEYQRLCTFPHIQQEISRLRSDRGNSRCGPQFATAQSATASPAPPPPESIEMAAKALFDAMPSNNPNGPPNWDNQPERIKEVFRARARHARS
jgi:hypothetical protein